MHGNVEPLLQGCLILSLFTGFTNGIQFLIVQLQTAYLVAAKLGQVIGDIPVNMQSRSGGDGTLSPRV